MMHLELKANDQRVTSISVVNKRQCADNGEGWFVYEWTAYRPAGARTAIRRYATGELSHRRGDGIEELAVKVLMEYQRWMRARDGVLAD